MPLTAISENRSSFYHDFINVCLFFLLQGDFVAIFANANHGDTSPNTNGPKCIDTGLACRRATSTCNDRVRIGKHAIGLFSDNSLVISTKGK